MYTTVITNITSSPIYFRRLSSSNKKTFYEILNVPTGSNLKEIKSQYYKLCKLLHPDTKTLSSDKNSTDFHDILKAYDTLKDPKKRREYDRSLALTRYQPAPSSLNEFRRPKEQKSTDESIKFWSKMNAKREKEDRDDKGIKERLEEIKVFRNRFIVLGAVLIGYLISNIKGG